MNRTRDSREQMASDKARSEKEVEEAIKDGRKLVECGAMVCQWKKMISCGARSVFLLLHCWACNRAGICTQCGSVQWDQDQFEKHWCQRTPQNNAEEALKGMTRGKDYQICPNPECKEVFALKDGCVSYSLPLLQLKHKLTFQQNFVRCKQVSCSWGSSFLCGKGPLEHNDDHWTLGKPCPRFNQPVARNEMYDRSGMGLD